MFSITALGEAEDFYPSDGRGQGFGSCNGNGRGSGFGECNGNGWGNSNGGHDGFGDGVGFGGSDGLGDTDDEHDCYRIYKKPVKVYWFFISAVTIVFIICIS